MGMGLCAACIAWGVLVAGARAQSLAAAEDAAMKAAVAVVAPSTVRIETVGGQERVGDFRATTAATTGLVVSADGYILSSAYGFVQEPSAILVRVGHETPRPATIVARDRSRMLVLLKIDTDKSLPVPEFAERENMRVGQWALAVGRTYSLEEPNVSAGIVSAIHRIWSRAIQTDAKISPANYGGPLVDIHGHVLGLLVPLAPDQQNELAGIEWYDSGIGFAVPLAEIMPHLEQMKRGEDLRPGLLGVTLKGRNEYADPAIVATCAANSPATAAGLKVNDKIVEINGRPIARQTELKHALGPLYAGETARVVVLRGDQRMEFQVTLAATIDPYEHPFLGILPMRDVADDRGIVVRYVYPDSPAAKAQLQADDVLIELNGQPLSEPNAWRDAIAVLQPEDEVSVTFVRGSDAPQEARVTLARLPEALPPDDLPTPSSSDAEPAEPQLVTLKVPEMTNSCLALIPGADALTRPHGVVVWLGNPGKLDEQQFRDQWTDAVKRYPLIVLAPEPEDVQRWQPTEMEFIRKVLDQAMKNYAIDPARVMVYGYQAGGSLAYRFTMKNRDVVRALAVVETAMPVGMELRGNDPVERLAYYVAYGDASPLAEQIDKNLAQLREHKFPVVVHRWTGEPRMLTDEESDQLVRWSDTLDRL